MWKRYILFIVCSEVYVSLLYFLDEIISYNCAFSHIQLQKDDEYKKKMVQDEPFINSLFN